MRPAGLLRDELSIVGVAGVEVGPGAAVGVDMLGLGTDSEGLGEGLEEEGEGLGEGVGDEGDGFGEGVGEEGEGLGEGVGEEGEGLPGPD